MGVQPPPKKKDRASKISDLEESLRNMQTQLDELKHGDQADDEHDKDHFPRRGRGARSRKPQTKNVQGAEGRYVPPPETDDDEEEVPPKIEKLWAVQVAKKAHETSTGRKRKQHTDVSALAERDEDNLVRPTDRKAEREVDSLARKRARSCSDSDEVDMTPTAAKKSRAGPPFVPLPKKPLLTPEWATPAKKPSTGFTLPASSQKINDLLNQKTPTAAASAQSARNKKQQSLAELDSQGPSVPNNAASSKPAYDESEPFEFKLIVSHPDQPGQDMAVYLSSDLKDRMKAFWPLQRKQLEQWEDAAGANWAWELQKTQKSRGHKEGKRRFCVSSKVAKQATRWRKGDNGNYACKKCASNASLCFTWVAGEEAEAEKDEDAVISAPQGEFWCLPVHPSDRRCEVTKGREIRTWLNEGDNSESDSSGNDDGDESDADEYKLESDFDPLVSEYSSSEENKEESDFDDGC